MTTISNDTKSSAHPHPNDYIDADGRCLWCRAEARAEVAEASATSAEAAAGALRAALVDIEWAMPGDRCPCCKNIKVNAHNARCYVGKLVHAALSSSAGARAAEVIRRAEAITEPGSPRPAWAGGDVVSDIGADVFNALIAAVDALRADREARGDAENPNL